MTVSGICYPSSLGCCISDTADFFILMVNKDMGEIVNNFGGFYRDLTSKRRLCGILQSHDRDLSTHDAKQLLFCMGFRYITDVLTDEEAEQFKLKVGADLQDDICRCRSIREKIGLDKIMMLDANLQWEIKEAVQWVTKPAEYKPSLIKKPVFADEDIHVQMGLIFKQLLQAKALSYLQIDSCSLGSVNENLSVLVMAKKFQSKAL
ncbi:mitochondrial enolase superfamily member 1 [Rhynochetos jubatus]